MKKAKILSTIIATFVILALFCVNMSSYAWHDGWLGESRRNESCFTKWRKRV